MKGLTRGIFKVCGILLLIGAALCIAGLIEGGRPRHVTITTNNGVPILSYGSVADPSPQTQTGEAPEILAESQSIHSLSVDIEAAEVQIVSGTEFGITVDGNENYSQNVHDGVWEISDETTFAGSVANYVITVPQGTVFDTVDLSIGAGTMSAGGIQCSTATLQVGAGSMNLSDFTTENGCDISVGVGSMLLEGKLQGSNEIEVGMGNLECDLEMLQDYGYSVSCGMGNVSIGGKRHSGMGVDTSVNTDSENFFAIDCGLGNINIEFK